MRLRFVFLLALCLSLLTGVAQAQDYAKPSWPDLLRTMVRFRALDLSDTPLLDEYAVVTECDLYKAFYANDFKWNQVRKAVMESVKMNVATFPMNYHYDLKMQLDRYDFAARLFRFTNRSTLRGINTFMLYSVRGTGCGNANVVYLPRTFRAVLETPVSMDGLPLAAKDAQALLDQMDRDKDSDRIIYARFNLRVVFIDAWRKIVNKEGGTEAIPRYEQTKAPMPDTVRFDVNLDSISFYEDPEMTRLIYQN
ncbi:MAG: DUF4852 domain-containing protein [Alphaproteobacteria bacterium]|nr:DUF4852 domain-containing protein [Alphaproteobacteria bacterium]